MSYKHFANSFIYIGEIYMTISKTNKHNYMCKKDYRDAFFYEGNLMNVPSEKEFERLYWPNV